MRAILLVSHGSRSSKTKEEIVVLVNILRQSLAEDIVDYAFLEIEAPGIPEGIDKCAAQGVSEIVVALNFLNSGRHVNEDIPAIVRAAQEKYPQINFCISQPVGQHPQIPNLFIDLINDTE